MSDVSRREFLKISGVLATSLGLAAGTWEAIPAKESGQVGPAAPAAASEPLAAVSQPPAAAAPALHFHPGSRLPAAADSSVLLWLHGLSCSGCSVSFLNSSFPSPASVITQYLSLDYHAVISAAAGDLAMQAINQRIEAGNTLLAVEGAVPVGLPGACKVGEEDFTSLLQRAARAARAVLAVGTCATHGGIPGAQSNPTGAVSVRDFLASKGISTPVINLPGCPTHPDWVVGSLVYLLQYGTPPLTEDGSPAMFYGEVLHDNCPRFYQYNMGKFATQFGEDGCLFKLGCLGIRTKSDCPARRWNNKVSWCIEAGAPCIGCTQPSFARAAGFPFYRVQEAGGVE